MAIVDIYQVVSVNGVTISSNEYSVEPWGIIYYGTGLQFTSPNNLIYPSSYAQITYTGGLDGTKIGTIQLTLIKAVLRELAKVHAGASALLGYKSMKVEDFSWSKSKSATGDLVVGSGILLDGELSMLNKYKKRLVL
jgi:hypothetical protein